MAADVQQTADGLELTLTGDWSCRQFAALEAQLDAIDLSRARQVRIDAQPLSTLDLSGAWALHQFIARARSVGSEVSFKGDAPVQLRLLDETLQQAQKGIEASPPRPPAPEHGPLVRLLARVGRQAERTGGNWREGLAFLGRTFTTGAAALLRPRHLRPISIARHVYETGITALPIVALIAFLISVIIAYMSARQLSGLGADIYVVDLVTIGVLRELGVLLTAIIVAGRSGSAFAAELGSMKLNQEVDALIATGVDPFEVLVVPRVVGLSIALPLLTVVSDIVGIAGGAFLCRFLLDMPFSQYLGRVNDAIGDTTFWVGLVKAPVFALLIAAAGCYRGLQVRDSARELGRLVTVAVVESIFFVILADALFAVLFMEMNI
ncbi:MAG TPA: ABC transporter permease [Steroidobacteraceae bacterium]|nr:ABC transporter permease [Steroidobacteraceae bacterium]